jgi:hypothetical protein
MEPLRPLLHYSNCLHGQKGKAGWICALLVGLLTLGGGPGTTWLASLRTGSPCALCRVYSWCREDTVPHHGSGVTPCRRVGGRSQRAGITDLPSVRSAPAVLSTGCSFELKLGSLLGGKLYLGFFTDGRLHGAGASAWFAGCAHMRRPRSTPGNIYTLPAAGKALPSGEPAVCCAFPGTCSVADPPCPSFQTHWFAAPARTRLCQVFPAGASPCLTPQTGH